MFAFVQAFHPPPERQGDERKNGGEPVPIMHGAEAEEGGAHELPQHTAECKMHDRHQGLSRGLKLAGNFTVDENHGTDVHHAKREQVQHVAQ